MGHREDRIAACAADPWGEGAIRYPPEIARSGDRPREDHPVPRRNTITIHAYPTQGPDTITLVDCPQHRSERDPDLDPRPGVRMIVLPEGALHATRLTLDPMAVRQLRAALARWEQGKDLAEPT
jgi:hypothetical protein